MSQDVYVAERHALAAMSQFPNKWHDVSFFVKEEDFSHPVHKIIFNVLKQSIENKEHPNDVIISSRIKQSGIQIFEDLPIEDYVKNIFETKINENNFKDFFKELSFFKVQRRIKKIAKELDIAAKKPDTNSIAELITKTDHIYSEGIKDAISLQEDEFDDICIDLPNIIEDLRENPPDDSKIIRGPFPTFNLFFDSLNIPGEVNCFCARSGVGKTSINLFYHIWVAEKYGLPILWMDNGEMSKRQIQLRIAAAMTGGVVPLHAIKYGEWARNVEWCAAIRAVWSRVQKIRFHYLSIAGKSSLEIFSYARRYQNNIVGRGNQFLWVYDYIKPIDDDPRVPEWKILGKFIQDVKSFVQNEVVASFNTSLQANKKGVTTNKKEEDVEDSEEAFGGSDRILQQCSFGFLLRRKTNDAFIREGGRFGNLICSFPKTRELGREEERAMKPVKLPNGKTRANYINLRSKNFFFEDLGDLNQMIQEAADIFEEPDETQERNPLS